MKDTFTINELAMITSLTTRTLRNYLTAGVLEGSKVGGVWQFTAEQVQSFMENKAVKPSVLARKNAIVFDFMGSRPEKQDKICTILDLTAQAAVDASVFLCQKISELEPELEFHFASNPLGKGARLILSGSPKDVLGLLNGYYSREE